MTGLTVQGLCISVNPVSVKFSIMVSGSWRRVDGSRNMDES